jgi:hypothetical protein
MFAQGLLGKKKDMEACLAKLCFFLRIIIYSLGCGASCDSSDIQA